MSKYEIHNLADEIKEVDSFETKNLLVCTLFIMSGQSQKDIFEAIHVKRTEADLIKHKNLKTAAQRCLEMAQKLVTEVGQVAGTGLAIFTGECGGVRMSKALVPVVPISRLELFVEPSFLTSEFKLSNGLAPIYGYAVVDGKGGICALSCGKSTRVLGKFGVEQPAKDKQKSEKQQMGKEQKADPKATLRQMQELMRCFIGAVSGKPTIDGLIVAGQAQLKNQLAADFLDPKLKKILVGTLDVAQGAEQGVHLAIEKAPQLIKEFKMKAETETINAFLGELAKNKNTHVSGLLDVYHCLQMGAVESILIVEQDYWEKQDFLTASGETIVKFVGKDSAVEADQGDYAAAKPGQKLTLLQYYIKQEEDAGVEITLLEGLSEAAQQFLNGYGGVGATLRWPVDSTELVSQLKK